MIEPFGREELLAMLLARVPEGVLDMVAAVSPGDAAELARLRDTLADLALAAEPVAPPPSLRERVLARRLRRPERPVLVVLDMLNDHLTPGLPMEVPRARDIVPALQRRLAEARARRTPVVYVCDSHEDDDGDGLPDHARAGTEGAEVWPALAPEEGDRVVTKGGYSGFHGSDLGRVLDELDADEIVLTGCATEIGLMATATEALDRGFVVTVPRETQAGMSAMGEHMTLLTLLTMKPHHPRYLRHRAPGHDVGHPPAPGA
jgi:nicotinamidase-related amidase